MTTSVELKAFRKSIIITLISVLTPFLVAITVLWIKDHFKIMELSQYKVSKEYFDDTWFKYQLLIEKKTLSLENLSSNNNLEIAEIKADISTIQQANQQIMLEIARINRTRDIDKATMQKLTGGTK